MAILKSGATSDLLTIDPVSKALRSTLYDSAGRQISDQSLETFAASGAFTPAATPTDLVTLFGSASKTIRVMSFEIFTNNTAAGSQTFFLVKRNAVNTGGTPVAATIVPFDSTDAATATAVHYTANPAALGTAVGTVRTIRVASPVLVPATFAGVREIAGQDLLAFAFNSNLSKPIVLRGIAQGLCLNFNGVALVGGQIHAYNLLWTEE